MSQQTICLAPPQWEHNPGRLAGKVPANVGGNGACDEEKGTQGGVKTRPEDTGAAGDKETRTSLRLQRSSLRPSCTRRADESKDSSV